MPDKEVEVKEDFSEIPEDFKKYIDNPFGGLFGRTVRARIVEKIVANPSRIYSPKDLVEMLGISDKSASDELKILTELKLLKYIGRDSQRPLYETNLDSKQLTALTILAYAVIDDRKGTDLMDSTIINYYNEVPGQNIETQSCEVTLLIPEATVDINNFNFIFPTPTSYRSSKVGV